MLVLFIVKVIYVCVFAYVDFMLYVSVYVLLEFESNLCDCIFH